MKISYLDGERFFNGLRAGTEMVIKNRDQLNRINVFPVADADTGTNLAATMRLIVENSRAYNSLQETLQSIADSALSSARGNSGIIFAQYLHGLRQELSEKGRVKVHDFADTAHKAVRYMYDALLEPVEGTMLTVIRAWADSLKSHSTKYSDFSNVLKAALKDAQSALQQTRSQLKSLKEAGVVDAGAKGFVHFLEGITHFISTGSLKKQNIPQFKYESAVHTPHDLYNSEFRFCTEAILHNLKTDLKDFKQQAQLFGDSIITAGSIEKMHFHIHTNHPEELLNSVTKSANVIDIKVDDMQQQFELTHHPGSKIALVTDSACDLPAHLIDEFRIIQIPFNIHFGDNLFLDKKTISADNFYSKLRTEKDHPKSSQPAPARVRDVFTFLSSVYPNIISIHISEKLTGIFQSALNESKNYSGKIAVFNSRHLSVSLGLIVYRAAEAIQNGMDFEELKSSVEQWISKTQILVDVDTLKYMIRGGRVPKMQGIIAGMLNIKPIVTLDEQGKADAFGKSFSRNGNMKKILRTIEETAAKNKIRNYAIVHADNPGRAEKYAKALTAVLGSGPKWIMPLSPVVGVHNGIGAVAIGLMLE